MFQDFTQRSDPAQGAGRLARLRAEMDARDVQGFIVPLADAHQGEYVAPCDARLAWLTGFTGSAGFALVLPDLAGVFVDGRYRVQVKTQVDLSVYTPVPWPEERAGPWIRAHLTAGRVAYDPWLHTAADIDAMQEALQGSDVTLVAMDNLVDAIWTDRPDRPNCPPSIHPVEVAGRPHGDKIASLAQQLRTNGHRATAVTQTDALCWLLNIRGQDIPRNPIAQGFALLRDDATVQVFTDAEISAELRAHLGDSVTVHGRAAFLEAARAIDGPVLVDRDTAPVILRDQLADAVLGQDPTALPKACKNPVEVAGTRAAHLRDGAAVVAFLAWLDAQPAGSVTEIDATKQLETARAATGALREISFDTIAGTGPHGAIMHYRVTEDTNRTLAAGDLFLIDSGGQYVDGTTDITRTVPVGPVQDTHRAPYTRVLQGLIALHRVRFPRGVSGSDLDALARVHLWMAGQDFDHGTGHGVGSYLCVHEGPQRISRVSRLALQEGMILSNEPGYYREGAFGIRLENLMVTRKAPPLPDQDDRDWLDFEGLTFVPFDRRLIELSLLSTAERAWLDSYHQEVLHHIAPLVDGDTRTWLEAACAPL